MNNVNSAQVCRQMVTPNDTTNFSGIFQEILKDLKAGRARDLTELMSNPTLSESMLLELFTVVKKTNFSPEVVILLKTQMERLIDHYDLAFRIRLAILMVEQKPLYLMGLFPKLNIKNEPDCLRIFLLLFEKHADAILNEYNIRDLINWFGLQSSVYHEAALLGIINCIQNIPLFIQKIGFYFVNRDLFNDQKTNASFFAKMALALISRHPLIGYEFLEQYVKSADDLSGSDRSELVKALNSLQLIKTTAQKICHCEVANEVEFNQILQVLPDETSRYLTANYIVGSSTIHNQGQGIKKLISFFTLLQISDAKQRYDLIKKIVAKFNFWNFMSVVYREIDEKGEFSIDEKNQSFNLKNEIMELICSCIKTFGLNEADRIAIFSEIASNCHQLLEKIPGYATTSIEQYEMIFLLMKADLIRFVTHLPTFTLISAQQRLLLIRKCITDTKSFEVLNLLASTLKTSISGYLGIEQTVVDELLDEIEVRRLRLLIRKDPETFYLMKETIKEMKEANKLRVLFFLIKQLSPEFKKAKENLCEVLDDLELTASVLNEAVNALIQTIPICCMAKMKLDETQRYKAIRMALILEPWELLKIFKSSDRKLVKGQKNQYEFALQALIFDTFPMFDSEPYESSPSYFEFFQYMDELSEEKMCDLVKEMLAQTSKNSIRRFLIHVVENENCPLEESFAQKLQETVAQIKPDYLLPTCLSLMTRWFSNESTRPVAVQLANKLNVDLDDVQKLQFIFDMISKRSISLCNCIEIFAAMTFKNPVLHRKIVMNFLTTSPQDFAHYFKKFTISDPNMRAIYAMELAIKNPGMLCNHLKNFEIDDKQQLAALGYCIYKQNRSLLKNHFDLFEIPALIDLDQKEIKELSGLTKDALEVVLQTKYYEVKEPELLKLVAKELIKRERDLTQDYEMHWAARFFEKAASLYQTNGNVKKAIALRIKLAEMPLISQNNPLYNLEEALKQPFVLEGMNGLLNFGAPFQYMGSNTLKGGCFHVKDTLIEGQPVREITFKLAYWAAEKVRNNLKLLESEESPLRAKVQILNEPFTYSKAESGNNTGAKQDIQVPLQYSLKVTINGLGVVQIGDGQFIMGSISNSVRIKVDPNASIKIIQRVFALMGLAEALTQATPDDIKRILTNTLIQFRAPQFAAVHDAEENYHIHPLDELISRLPSVKIRRKIKKDSKQIKTYSVCGDKRFALRRLADKAEVLDGVGFFTHCKGDIREIASRLGTIFKSGFLSTQKRFELGLTHIKGDSSEKDIQKNSADGVFFRLFSKSSLHKNITESNIKGDIQIFAKLKAIELLPYFYSKDEFGSRLRTDTYKNRPDFTTFFSEQIIDWNANNEVIFKNRLDPRYLCAITYQDPRKVIVEAIEKSKNVSFFSIPMTPSEKVEKLTEFFFSSDTEKRKTILNILKGSNLNQSELLYRKDDKSEWKHLESHWLCNPKEAIQESLEKAGVNPSSVPIIETQTFSPELMSVCHKPLALKVRELALKPHESTRLNIRDDYAAMIELMQTHLQNVSNEQLEKKVDEEVKISIAGLKTKCEKYLKNIGYSGQNSLNRELLTQEWGKALHQPKVILGLFALHESNQRDPKRLEICFDARINANQCVERKISECLYKGIKDNHPVLLERLPNNQTKGKVLSFSSKHGKMKYLREYIRRSKIQHTFIQIFKGIEGAYEMVMQQRPAPYVPSSSVLSQPYNPQKWKDEYPAMFKKVLEWVDHTSEDSLLQLTATQYSNNDLVNQVHEGLKILLEYEKLTLIKMKPQELIKYITECDYLLDQKAAHLFYDRLHFIAALKLGNQYKFSIENGEMSPRELIEGIIASFQTGINTTNSIAAEQFYLRIVQIYEKLV